jgi:hypothetical protein
VLTIISRTAAKASLAGLCTTTPQPVSVTGLTRPREFLGHIEGRGDKILHQARLPDRLLHLLRSPARPQERSSLVDQKYGNVSRGLALEERLHLTQPRQTLNIETVVGRGRGNGYGQDGNRVVRLAHDLEAVDRVVLLTGREKGVVHGRQERLRETGRCRIGTSALRVQYAEGHEVGIGG